MPRKTNPYIMFSIVCFSIIIVILVLLVGGGLFPLSQEQNLYLRPNGRGDINQLLYENHVASPRDVQNYMLINEVTPDYLQGYVYAWSDDTSGFYYDTYQMDDPNPALKDYEIKSLTINYYVYNVHWLQTYQQQCRAVLRYNNQESFGEFTFPYPPQRWIGNSWKWDKNPFTNKNWQWTDLINLQIGFGSNCMANAYSTVYCTQVYLAVNYGEPTPPETPPPETPPETPETPGTPGAPEVPPTQPEQPATPEEPSQPTPGFETILSIIAIIATIMCLRRQRKAN
jgi:hypothetical protein